MPRLRDGVLYENRHEVLPDDGRRRAVLANWIRIQLQKSRRSDLLTPTTPASDICKFQPIRCFLVCTNRSLSGYNVQTLHVTHLGSQGLLNSTDPSMAGSPQKQPPPPRRTRCAVGQHLRPRQKMQDRAISESEQLGTRGFMQIYSLGRQLTCKVLHIWVATTFPRPREHDLRFPSQDFQALLVSLPPVKCSKGSNMHPSSTPL